MIRKICKYCNRPHQKIEKEITYTQYLKTEHWFNIRKAYYASRAPKTCFICDSHENLNLHHRTYKHLWSESMGTHLNYLCKNCHTDVHFKYKKTPLRWHALILKQRKLLREFRKGLGASAAHQIEISSAMQNSYRSDDGNKI